MDINALRAQIKEQKALLEKLIQEERKLSSDLKIKPMRLKTIKTSSVKSKKKINNKVKAEKKPRISWRRSVNLQSIQRAKDVLAAGGKIVDRLTLSEARKILDAKHYIRDFGKEAFGNFLKERGFSVNSGQEKMLQGMTDENIGEFLYAYSEHEKEKRNDRKRKSAGNAKYSKQEATAAAFQARENAAEIATRVFAFAYIDLLDRMTTESGILSVALAVLNNVKDNSLRPRFRRNPADALMDYLDTAKKMKEGAEQEHLGLESIIKYGGWSDDEIEDVERSISQIYNEFQPYVD